MRVALLGLVAMAAVGAFSVGAFVSDRLVRPEMCRFTSVPVEFCNMPVHYVKTLTIRRPDGKGPRLRPIKIAWN